MPFVKLIEWKVLPKEEGNKMCGIKSLNDEHDCNVVSMNSLNIHDANDMKSHKLGDAIISSFSLCVENLEVMIVLPSYASHVGELCSCLILTVFPFARCEMAFGDLHRLI